MLANMNQPTLIASQTYQCPDRSSVIGRTRNFSASGSWSWGGMSSARVTIITPRVTIAAVR
jgi:hypothetical protein